MDSNSLKEIKPVIKMFIKNPVGVLKGFNYRKDEYYRSLVVQKHKKEKGLRTVDIHKLFQNFNETVDPFGSLNWSSMPTDIALLIALAKRFKKCHYLEIGTWRGESTANVAKIAEKCVSISFSDEQMKEQGFDEKYTKNSRFFSKKLKNVKHIGADSQTYDFSKLKQKFDLIFIDGDHSYEGVLKDTKNCLKQLKNKNSIIVWHDYGTSPETINWEIFAAILDGVPKTRHDRIYHVSNTLCAIYTSEKLQGSFIEFPTIPNKNFRMEITIKDLKD